MLLRTNSPGSMSRYSVVADKLKVADALSARSVPSETLNPRWSVEKRWNRDRFEPVIRGTAAGDLPAKRRALPRLDQQGGEFLGGSSVIGAVLAGTQTRRECGLPAAEDADQFGAYRFARTAELEGHVADQAAEQEIPGLVFISERI